MGCQDPTRPQQLLKPGEDINSEVEIVAQSPARRGHSGTRIQRSTLQNHGSLHNTLPLPAVLAGGPPPAPSPRALSTPSPPQGALTRVVVRKGKHTGMGEASCRGEHGLGLLCSVPAFSSLPVSRTDLQPHYSSQAPTGLTTTSKTTRRTLPSRVQHAALGVALP